MNNRIGVYICHCGDNISQYVDIKKVMDAVATEKGVVMVKDTMFACAGSTQQEIVDDIKREKLDGMVVASCSPKLHLFTFRDVALRGGLNPYLYVQANIREQCSWAHSDKPQEATQKAIKVVKSAIAKTRLSQALITQQITSENTVLVIGAGIAGMRSSIELADMGSKVYLIEKNHFVGGRIVQWGTLFSTDQGGKEIVGTLYEEVKKRENITLLTGTEIVSTSGSVGNFDIYLRTNPRYINSPKKILDKDKFKEEINQAINICPEETSDGFDFDITNRKALYWNHNGQLPEFPVIDDQTCTRCGECVKICPEIDLGQKQQSLRITVGAVVLCTGFDPYQPPDGEFGYKTLQNVITLQEFRRLLEINQENELVYNNRRIKNIAYIYCVGSRQVEGDNKYCSRICCTSTLHTSLLVKQKYEEINNFHFHRGMRSYGKNESLYTAALDQGDLFFQSEDDELPTVNEGKKELLVKINDILSQKMDIGVKADLVVLATAMVPRKEKELVEILKVPVGRDGFFNEIHPKLKPVETVIDGIYISGVCHFPKNIEETLHSALSSSIKAFSLIGRGVIELEPTLATIDRETCEWCDKCHKVCPFDAIKQEDYQNKKVAVVNEANCKGCGMCLPVCPSNSIQLIGYTDEEIKGMIKALV